MAVGLAIATAPATITVRTLKRNVPVRDAPSTEVMW
jgi:hypothetical protein